MFKNSMWFLIAVIAYVISMPSHATDTLDCVGEPYSIMIHIGYEENGDDFLADLLLYKDGQADPVAIYYNNNIEIAAFKWLSDVVGNLINISSKPGSEVQLKLEANDSKATVKVYEK